MAPSTHRRTLLCATGVPTLPETGSRRHAVPCFVGAWSLVVCIAAAPVRGETLEPATASSWHLPVDGVAPHRAMEGDALGHSMVRCDFDGDGFDDVATGLPGRDDDRGAVAVRYGSEQGLAESATVILPATGQGVPGTARLFGFRLAASDFNGDGRCDLAVSSPLEDVLGVTEAGSVHIFVGGPTGLSQETQRLHQSADQNLCDGTVGVVPHGSDPEAGDWFGTALAAGNFNDDPYADLAVGAPVEDLGGLQTAGHVMVFHGSPCGLIPHAGLHQNRPDIVDQAEPGDQFGYALAAADFNNDHFDDLAIGVVDEDLQGVSNVGAVHVLLGSLDGLQGTSQAWFSELTPGIGAAPEESDRWGEVLTAGDFDRDGFDDLAIGTPFESVGSHEAAGAVNVLYGASPQITADRWEIWTDNSTGGTSAANEQLGYALAAGDINGDGFDDLAIGVPREESGAGADRGAVLMTYGSEAGLSGISTQRIFPTNSSSPAELFGHSVAIGDFNGNGHAELVSGSPAERLPCGSDCVLLSAGRMTVVGTALLFRDEFESGGTASWSQTQP